MNPSRSYYFVFVFNCKSTFAHTGNYTGYLSLLVWRLPWLLYLASSLPRSVRSFFEHIAMLQGCVRAVERSE